MTLRIANAAGFLGDNLDAPRLLVENAQVDFLTLEYLAELTLSILARAREKDPNAGYAGDFLDVLGSLGPALLSQPQLRVITNAGGVNPIACARAAGRILVAAGMPDELIGVVAGDDLLDRLTTVLAQGCDLKNLETGEPLASLRETVVSANAYLGAAPLVESLDAAARLVVTGRVADASLTVAPAMHRFRWSWDDWDRLAAASVAGHLIECGAQVTGGYSTTWRDLALADVGYPIGELSADGRAVITKPAGSGGSVNRRTVTEQLIYEIGDPAHYLTPDVDVDFTTVELDEICPDRVAVRGATGRLAPESYKVSLAYRAGFSASGQLLVYGRDCVDKAQACARMILARVARAGFVLAQTHVECLGTGRSVPGVLPPAGVEDLTEVVLRISVQDPRREAVERFTKELAPLITSGPAGLAGYAGGRSPVRPVLAYWPALVPKEFVRPTVEVRTAATWVAGQ